MAKTATKSAKKSSRLEAQNPLILRCNRLMEAFAKSDDERDFYLDRQEGFIVYVDLDKPVEDLQVLERELESNADRYCLIPKLTFYETKKIMEGFINEKVYDIDTKEKLLDIIQSKEARENFLEFIYDHLSELEKWQSYYQERSRIRIIEWLRTNHFHFVFEEDLELPAPLLEKLKRELFQTRVGKDIIAARKTLVSKSKTYYSNEALNPRPKRGRPPKQALKAEVEKQVTTDIYTTVPNGLLGFLFIPDLTNASSATFSSKFGNEEDLFTHRRPSIDVDLNSGSLDQKLAALRVLSSKWKEPEPEGKRRPSKAAMNNFNDVEDEFGDDDEEEDEIKPLIRSTKSSNVKPTPSKRPVQPSVVKKPVAKTAPAAASKGKTSVKKTVPAATAKRSPTPIKKAPAKAPVKAPAKPAKPPLKKIINTKTKPKPVLAKRAPPPKKKPAPSKAKPKPGALRPIKKLKPKKKK